MAADLMSASFPWLAIAAAAVATAAFMFSRTLARRVPRRVPVARAAYRERSK